MSRRRDLVSEPGPFRVDQLRSKDRYELHDGHPVYCVPTGGSGSRKVTVGAAVLATDPAVTEAGVDTGYAPRKTALYAPDVAVGNVPDEPGWVEGVPPLAVEYAGRGQDEEDLATKIADLLGSGTRYLWVVRHEPPDGAPPFVEAYDAESFAAGAGPLRLGTDGVLTAPGVLKNPVSVSSLLEPEAAHAAVLTNLVQRRGYESFEAALRSQLDAGLSAGRREGSAASWREAIETLCASRGIDLDAELRDRLAGETGDQLAARFRLLVRDGRLE